MKAPQAKPPVTRPSEFWINNDHDEPASGNNPDQDLNAWGVPPQNPPDYSYGAIRCQRNLEDFARLWVRGLPKLPPSQGYAVTLTSRRRAAAHPASLAILARICLAGPVVRCQHGTSRSVWCAQLAAALRPAFFGAEDSPSHSSPLLHSLASLSPV